MILKVYGSAARRRREQHALNALTSLDNTSEILDSGLTDGMQWTLFEDAGRRNLESLPENPGLARTAGKILKELHATEKALISNLEHGPSVGGGGLSVNAQAPHKV